MLLLYHLCGSRLRNQRAARWRRRSISIRPALAGRQRDARAPLADDAEFVAASISISWAAFRRSPRRRFCGQEPRIAGINSSIACSKVRYSMHFAGVYRSLLIPEAGNNFPRFQQGNFVTGCTNSQRWLRQHHANSDSSARQRQSAYRLIVQQWPEPSAFMREGIQAGESRRRHVPDLPRRARRVCSVPQSSVR